MPRSALLAFACLTVAGAHGCKREQPAAQPTPPATAQPTAWQSYNPPPATAPAATTAPQGQPAPYAPPCQQPEGTCAFAKCNMTVGRCMWPCSSDNDCIAGARCVGPPGLSQCIGFGPR